MITIVDYGLGNVLAFADIYKRLNISVAAAQDRQTLRKASRIILPGVGAFDWAMTRLRQSGMSETLDELVLGKATPVLGVCVGMQMMARGSDEGQLPGLGWIPGQVRRFGVTGFKHKTHLPHMGWNDVAPQGKHGLFAGLSEPRFYFLHSYFFQADEESSVLATTDYSGRFASAVGKGGIVGTQFHPEKSHQWGVQLLKNFAEL